MREKSLKKKNSNAIKIRNLISFDFFHFYLEERFILKCKIHFADAFWIKIILSAKFTLKIFLTMHYLTQANLPFLWHKTKQNPSHSRARINIFAGNRMKWFQTHLIKYLKQKIANWFFFRSPRFAMRNSNAILANHYYFISSWERDLLHLYKMISISVFLFLFSSSFLLLIWQQMHYWIRNRHRVQILINVIQTYRM